MVIFDRILISLLAFRWGTRRKKILAGNYASERDEKLLNEPDARLGPLAHTFLAGRSLMYALPERKVETLQWVKERDCTITVRGVLAAFTSSRVRSRASYLLPQCT